MNYTQDTLLEILFKSTDKESLISNLQKELGFSEYDAKDYYAQIWFLTSDLIEREIYREKVLDH